MADDQDRYDDQYEEDVGEEEIYENPVWLKETPFWAVSAILHVILFVILTTIILEKPREETAQLPIKIRPISKKKDKYDPTLKRDIKKTPKIPDPTIVEKPVILRKIDEVTPEIPKGSDLNNLTNVELLNDSVHDAIGVGGGAAGAYGERWGKGSLISEGGSEGTEEAVRAALEWLRRHQSPDGSWHAHNFVDRCKKTCANEDPDAYGDGRGFKEHNVGVTGLAILAFAGYGHTHQDGVYPEYVQVLKKAVKFLKGNQVRSSNPSENGRFGSGEHEQWIYDHSIATMAMGELLAMSNDVLGLKKTVTNAVKLCLHAQNNGHGWKYGIKPGNNDTSVTGWMVLALKTAKNARVDIPREDYTRAFSGALRWFDRATSEATGKTGYEVPGDEGSRLASETDNEKPYAYSKNLSCMTAVGVLCRLFAGESRSTPIIKRGVDILMRETPRWVEQEEKRLSRINVYYWYYGSYAMFQFGGSLWKKWNVDMQKALLATQRQGNIDEDGSWDPIGEWGLAGGRVYSTALGAMTLEVYYRFVRAQSGVGF